MEYLATSKEMKQIDWFTMNQIGIPSMVLMERAALRAVEELERDLKERDKILIICGTGNNGADGIAVSRILQERGCQTSLLIVGNLENATPEFQKQLHIAKELQLSVSYAQDSFDQEIFKMYNILVDGLFGVGLSRPVTGIYHSVVAGMNLSKGRIISLDLPSGLNGETGKVMGVCIKADKTITFGCKKVGMLLYPGREYCGEIVVKDIGFPAVSFKQAGISAFTYNLSDIGAIPKRPAYSNKGTFGKILIIAGSKNMSGAAYLCALAAYRMGAGLVRIFTVEDNRLILQSQLPEAILTTFEPEDLEDSLIEEVCSWATVIAVGPGLSKEPYALQLLDSVLRQAFVPMVLDADALNLIAGHQELTSYFTENIIITPHLGEMSRLIKKSIEEIEEDPVKTAKEYSADYGVICVLKGAATLVTGEEHPLYVNSSGNSGMATAGSGDVLTGIIAGLLAGGMDEYRAATLGVYIHGAAGDRAKEKCGEYYMMAGDIISGIQDLRKTEVK